MRLQSLSRKLLVPRRGLEPPHPKAHGPEPCASTNSAIWASFRYNSVATVKSREFYSKKFIGTTHFVDEEETASHGPACQARIGKLRQSLA